MTNVFVGSYYRDRDNGQIVKIQCLLEYYGDLNDRLKLLVGFSFGDETWDRLVYLPIAEFRQQFEEVET